MRTGCILTLAGREPLRAPSKAASGLHRESPSSPGNPRPAAIGLAIALFAAFTAAAILQPDGDPAMQFRSWSHPARWLFPIQLNADAGRLALEGAVNAIASIPETDLVWAVGDGGLILHSSDGGWNWVKQNPPEPDEPPAQSSMFGPTVVHAAAQAAPQEQRQQQQQLYTPPPNQAEDTEPPKKLPSTSPPIRVPPRPVVTPKPAEPVLGELTDDLIDVQFDDARRGRAYGRYGTVLATADGGATWSFDPALGGNQQRTRRYWGAARTRARARLYASANEAAADCGISGEIFAVWCDEQSVWAADASGLRLPGSVVIPIPDDIQIRAIHFEPGRHRGWLAGTQGLILHTRDGGGTWTAQTLLPQNAGSPPARLPAPWYYLVTFPTIFLLVRKASQPLPPRREHSLVEGVLTSDAPIDETAPDVMGFGRMAQGISRFLRHERTLPPLTISIDGPWGSGKSSLMNLLRADLERYGFRPIWFNAWHHQREEHLLASLLDSIRSHAAPPWWRPDNWAFRARLLDIRGRRHWVAALLLLGVLSGLAVTLPLEDLEKFSWTEFAKNTAALAFLAAAISGAAAFWKGLTAFGVDPAKLLANVSARSRPRDLQMQTSFRETFAREFRDVTDALGPRSLIIFIDDIDRCTPENMLTVLESVNFLVSSGGCFIVIGMARDIVERAVALQFAPVVEELGDETGEATPEQRRERRLRFARQYLDKLINIEIPLPQPTDDQARRLLLERRREAAEPTPAEQFASAARRFAPAVLAAASVLVGLGIGYQVNQWRSEADFTATQAPAARQTAPASAQADSAPGAADDLRNVPPSPAPKLTPPRPPIDAAKWLIAAGFLMLGGFGIWKLREPMGLVVHDSEEFTRAIDAWCDVVRLRRNTPRSLKRFMNRVRYMAMHQMPPEPRESWFSGLLQRKGTAQPLEEEFSEAGMRESTLVALSALHYLDPALPARAAGLSGTAEPAIINAIRAHDGHGFEWPPSQAEIDRFYEIIPMVRMAGAKPAEGQSAGA